MTSSHFIIQMIIIIIFRMYKSQTGSLSSYTEFYTSKGSRNLERLQQQQQPPIVIIIKEWKKMVKIFCASSYYIIHEICILRHTYGLPKIPSSQTTGSRIASYDGPSICAMHIKSLQTTTKICFFFFRCGIPFKRMNHVFWWFVMLFRW